MEKSIRAILESNDRVFLFFSFFKKEAGAKKLAMCHVSHTIDHELGGEYARTK